MRYPEFLQKGGTIGLVAPSFGISAYPYKEKTENAIRKFKNLGYKLKFAKHIYGLSENARSTTAVNRAQEFMDMYLDDEVDAIFSVSGGELMMEILPYINFELLKNSRPKYFIGFSDNTNLTFTLTALADIPTIYGPCFHSYGMAHWHSSLQEGYEIITGKRNCQESYDRCCLHNLSKEPGKALDGYNLDEPVVIHSLSKRDDWLEGRSIGGCLDVLSVLCGTPYGDISAFLEKYREDGFVWFLEACDLNVMGQFRALWQLKQAGWFKYCKGIVYGRPILNEAVFGESVEEMLEEVFKGEIPVIYDANIGHIEPSWNIICGSYVQVEKNGNRAKITYLLK